MGKIKKEGDGTSHCGKKRLTRTKIRRVVNVKLYWEERSPNQRRNLASTTGMKAGGEKGGEKVWYTACRAWNEQGKRVRFSAGKGVNREIKPEGRGKETNGETGKSGQAAMGEEHTSLGRDSRGKKGRRAQTPEKKNEW